MAKQMTMADVPAYRQAVETERAAAKQQINAALAALVKAPATGLAAHLAELAPALVAELACDRALIYLAEEEQRLAQASRQAELAAAEQALEQARAAVAYPPLWAKQVRKITHLPSSPDRTARSAVGKAGA